MPNDINYALCSIPDLVELVQLQERMIKEQEEIIALLKEALHEWQRKELVTTLKEALKLQEGPCQI